MARRIFIWAAVAAVITVPIALAAVSPQLQWRHPVYIAAGFAGIIGLTLLFVQPLLIGRYLPGLSPLDLRRAHRWIGGLLVAAVAIHVGALWITSPPDVIDALLFASPTPFSPWGVIGMWATLAAGLLAVFRLRLRLRPMTWRAIHLSLAAIVVVCTILHAALIDGTMETVSKLALSALTAAATLKVITDFPMWPRARRRPEGS